MDEQYILEKADCHNEWSLAFVESYHGLRQEDVKPESENQDKCLSRFYILLMLPCHDSFETSITECQ